MDRTNAEIGSSELNNYVLNMVVTLVLSNMIYFYLFMNYTLIEKPFKHIDSHLKIPDKGKPCFQQMLAEIVVLPPLIP